MLNFILGLLGTSGMTSLFVQVATFFVNKYITDPALKAQYLQFVSQMISQAAIPVAHQQAAQNEMAALLAQAQADAAAAAAKKGTP